MGAVETHPERIVGPWVEGFALDRHVVSSRPMGYVGEHMQFDTTRSALGELVYQLKYKNGSPDGIIETAVAFVRSRWSGMVDCVISPPPSLHRNVQPTALIAEGLASALGAVHQHASVLKANATPQMKNIAPHERDPLLSAAIQPGSDPVDGKRVLIVDDLWETGSTLRRVAEVLGNMGAKEIRVLALTRTR